MTALLLVRHGLSTWNAAGRWQGWADPPLAAEGEAQAREAAPMLAGAGFTAVVHSGMQRTRRTAELLAEALDVPEPEVEAGLKEYDVGEWSGLTRPEIELRWPGALDQWAARTLPATPGGESRQAFTDRVLAAIHRVAATHPGGRVLCVTHGGVIGTIQRVLGDNGPLVKNLAGRWVEVSWEIEGPPRTTLGSVVHLLPPPDETESPSS